MTDQTAFVKRKRAPARNQLLWAAALLAALLLQKDGITQEVGDGAGNAGAGAMSGGPRHGSRHCR